MDRDEYIEYVKKFEGINIDEMRAKLVGKRVVLKNNLKDIFCKVGVTDEMIGKVGSILKIKRIIEGTQQIDGAFHDYKVINFDESGYSWELCMIEAILTDDMTPIKDEQDTVELSISKGDLVKYKKMLPQEDNKIGEIYGIPVIKEPIELNKEIPEQEFIVADIVDDVIYPYYFDDDYKNIIIKKDMVELVQEGYVQKVEKKKRHTVKEKKMLEELKIMEEMKNKVNIKDFKKIYAGSLKVSPTTLKGVELVLHQWAFNKKHLYKMLGKNLSITKEIEYQKTKEDMNGERETLYRECPALYYILREVSDTELLRNRLEHTYQRDWCQYGNSYDYDTGTKISKIINDALKNDKINTLYSDIVAQSKIRGVIEISIDPIEILLMSTNVSGWESCHRINEIGSNKSWGCFSGGIFSYMCDSTSMIAFRHNNKLYDFKIYNSKTQQRSKNWRQMVWINKDMTTFITSRQYPVKMDEITKQVREMLQEQICKYNKQENAWVHSDNQDKIKTAIADYKYRGLEKNILHYNDMLKGYKGDLCYRKGITIKDNDILVGSNPVCPHCGNEIMAAHNRPFCDNCSLKI